jgi:hypothetical protein
MQHTPAGFRFSLSKEERELRRGQKQKSMDIPTIFCCSAVFLA